VAEPARTSPLGAREGEPAAERRLGERLVLRERPFVGKLSLRGDAGDPAFAAAAERALGSRLPTVPGETNESQAIVLALAPDEWLVVLRDGVAAAPLLARLEGALRGFHAAIVDVSSATTILLLLGPGGRDLLARGCSVVLTGTGRCWQTRLARAPVLIYAPADDAERLDLFAPRSLALHLREWLVDASGPLS